MNAAVGGAAPFLLRRTRLISGLILFSYVTTHLLNHALGLISLEAAEDGRRVFLAFWRNPVGTVAIYGAALVHFLLALWAIYQRRRLLQMPFLEITQLVLGLCIVPLLMEHVLGTRIVHELHGTTDNYTYIVLVLWHLAPDKAVTQSLALVAAWTHGCIGLYYWLRLKRWYPTAQPFLYAAALLVPVLALLGFASMGRELLYFATDRDWMARAMTEFMFPTVELAARLSRVQDIIIRIFGFSVLATLAARLVRTWLEKRAGRVRLTYPGGRMIEISPGMTVLEASQLNGIPHASVCGGRGRCSTCRIRISAGQEDLPAPSTQEQAVLARVGAAPNMRLACQIRPTHDLTLVPLLAHTATASAGHLKPRHAQGQEKDIAILFADLRGFTNLSEHKLPYDVVFVLNRYFAAMGTAVERAGGHVDKFIGDGVMALFGIDSNVATGSRQALEAARNMATMLDELNQTLMPDLQQPLRIGIGIHVGPAIVGEMGYARAVSLTAIGDAVNTASRLESMTKEFGAQLVVSELVADAAQVDLSTFPKHDMEIRGRREMLIVRVIAHAHDLPGAQQKAPAA
jgi:adenylate cyclase